MKLKKLDINGFRSIANLSIAFDESLTVVVGENDAGKTSLIDCLKVVTQGRSVGVDDFTHNQNEMCIKVETADFVFEKRYRKNGDSVSEEALKASLTTNYIQQTIAKLNAPDFSLENEETEAFIRETARLFGLTVRSNSILANLKSQIEDKLSGSGAITIENASFPKFNNIQLDGKHFENVPAFFKEVFLKEKQTSLWHEQIKEGETIESFIRKHLESYSDEMSEQILQRGIIDKLRLFLPELTAVKVEPVFHTRDLNVEARVKFLEGGNEIVIENKGDGTKRRMTMALLEFKKEQTRVPNDDQTIYLLDEPDTHLHVRAQLDLVETVKGFSEAGSQVILTTHSPFIVNAAKPNQVRLLVRKSGSTTIKSLITDPAYSSKVLRALGIENTHLFFSRKLVIVEGETEEAFLFAQYLRQTGNTLSSGLIKTINVKGVQNIVGFARAILELHDIERIYILCDNDASQDLQDLIDELDVPKGNKFQIGTKEFEDSFSAATLYRCWAQYHNDCGKQPPAAWTEEAIERLKQQCLTDGTKFSSALGKLNSGGKALKKPIFGSALGAHTEKGELPAELIALLESLTNN